ncbi:MAG: RCC1 repeat-containing protein, partial [Polyangiaceae bacterium]|nr:RCC1 repeat-containing protein [Polyangiaceae bacterium]
NTEGQLGNDSTTESTIPVAVDGMDGTTSRAVRVSEGYYHSCEVLDTGAVNCWGRNEYGQLGDGSNSDSNTTVSVSGIDGTTEKAVSVSAGERHSCAVLETGAVNCWGYNEYGQLGDGSNNDSTTPVAVSGIDGTTNNAVSVAGGNYHSCAVLETGAVNCWGRNTEGQLGNDSTTESTIPVAVDGMDGITKKAASISIGYSHSCAVLDTGAINCWGYNGYGQLGDGTEYDSTSPVAVSVIDGTTNKAVSVSTGVSHSCAVLDTGAANCWGWNPYGQLGNDSTTSSSTPGAVNGIDGSTNKAVSISIGTSHSCSVLDTGAVNCWGLNGDGQLGDDSITSRYTPVAVVWP